MSWTPPSRPESALAGLRGGVRSALAPAPLSTAGAAAGIAAVLALGALEFAAGDEVLIAGLLVLPPLVVALTGRWGDTLLVAALALAVALVVPLLGDEMQKAVAIVLVIAGGLVAMAVAVARAGSVVALERFGLLVGVSDAADGAEGRHDALVDGVLDLLVPVFGDVAAIDVLRGGARRRIGARVAPGIDPAVASAMARRRPLEGETRSAEAAIATDRAQLVEPDDTLIAAAASTPQDAALLSDLQLTTALIVPLRSRGRVIGALSVAFGPSRRRHTESDLRFADLLAGRVALALDNAGLTSELSVAEEQFGLVLHALAEAVTMSDGAGRLVYVNPAAVELLHAGSADELIRADPEEIMDRYAVFDEHGRPLALADLPSQRLLAGVGRQRRIDRDDAAGEVAIQTRDQEQRDADDEEVGRDREDVPRFPDAAQVADREDGEEPQAHLDAIRFESGKRRQDGQDSGRDADRNGQGVIHEQRRGGDESRRRSDVFFGDDVRAASGRVGVNRLPV